LSGSEVEKIVRNDVGISNAVVGQITEIKPHPNADKLQLAYVDVGKGKPLEIVCGAPNIAVGQKVPCVLLGGSVPGLKIEPREIRGVKSQGMLAGYDELVESDDHAGIFILPPDSKIGTDVVKLLELDEPVLELDITPNRPDCFSIRGLSREVAALYRLQLTAYRSGLKESNKKASSVLSVEIKDKELCPKYCARVIQNVKVAESPLWMQNKLRQAGVRSINNVVDVTNYVMMELGHPLHAFDADKLDVSTTLSSARSEQGGGSPQKHVIVRLAKKGETILALDGNTYALNSTMLVIADKKKPIAIAGVMGGSETSVTEQTKNIVLEAAVFDPVSVRKTGRALSLRSESSARFEKGVDRGAVEEAIDRAAALIVEFSGGEVLKGIVSSGTKNNAAARIGLSTGEVERLLGVEVSVAKIKSILKSLGFSVSGSANTLTVGVPSWRAHDVRDSADLVEEIGRMLDYNTMRKTVPSAPMRSVASDAMHSLQRALRRYWIGEGYSEILTYTFYGEDGVMLSDYDKEDHITLTNPVNDEYPYVRASLVPWMLKKLSQNNVQLVRGRIQLFEIGNVFHRSDGESSRAVLGITDVDATPEALYRQLRGGIEGICGVRFEAVRMNDWTLLKHDGVPVGAARIAERGSFPGLKFRGSVGIVHIDLEAVAKAMSNDRHSFVPIPFYPTVLRDLGVVAPLMVEYTSIEGLILGFHELIKQVSLFDVYHGLDEGTSLAFRLTFYSTDRTLESAEVDEIMDALKVKLKKEYDVSFRD